MFRPWGAERDVGQRLFDAIKSGDTRRLRELIHGGVDLTVRLPSGGYVFGPWPFGGTALHWASIYGNVRMMSMLMKAGADLESNDDKGSKPMHCASASEIETDAAVRCLLKAGASLEALNRERKTPLHCAAEAGFGKIVKHLVGRRANLEARDTQGKTPLHYASEEQNEDVVKLLLRASANVEAIDHFGRTPLHYALLSFDFRRRGAIGVVTVLLKAGASLESAANGGRTPLHYAAIFRGEDAVRYLLDAGADFKALDLRQRTPLHYAAVNEFNGRPVRPFLEAGANADVRDKYNKTPLHYAADRPEGDGVRHLIDAKANVEAVADDGKTPLHYAAEGGDPRLLVDAGANLDATDHRGRTPLHCASAAGIVSAVQRLVDAGASINVGDENEKTPLHCAMEFCHAEVVRILLNAGSHLDTTDNGGRTPLHYSSKHNNDRSVKILAEAGAKLEIVDGRGRTPLLSAMLHGSIEVSRFLVAAGASPCLADTSGQTPLHCAALYGNRDMVKALLSAGASVQKTNDDGQTPLHCAVESGEEGTVQTLIDAGADINARDVHGQTPLHWAAESDRVEAVRILADAGANLENRDNEGMTPLQVASANANQSIVDLIKQKLSSSMSPTQDLRNEASAFDLYLFEKELGLRFSGLMRKLAAHGYVWSTRDFLGEEKDEGISAEIDVAVSEEPTSPLQAIQRLSVGTVFVDKYRIDSGLITGESYERSAVEVTSGRSVTLKFYENPELLQKCLGLHSRLDESECSCRLVDKVDSQGMLPGCLVLQKKLHTLAEWLRTPAISEENKLKALRSIAMVLKELHGHSLVHCGFSQENLAFFEQDQKWKLLHLDSVRSVDDQKRPFLIDFRYLAPEILLPTTQYSIIPYRPPRGGSADMWSYGLISYEILTGKRFYNERLSEADSIIDFLDCKLSKRLNAIRDRRHRHFIKKFLNLTPEKRQTAADALRSSLLRTETVDTADATSIEEHVQNNE